MNSFYERVVAETFLYFYRNRVRFGEGLASGNNFSPSRSIEQGDIYPHRPSINGGQGAWLTR